MKRILFPICLLAACTEVTPIPPVSLDGPTAIAIARGRVCLDLQADGDARIPIFSECADGRMGAIGLVVNEQSDRLTFVALDRSLPALADLRQSVPGVTHLTVGRLPVDVAASADGTIAYTLNQIDSDISIVNLWKPEVHSVRLQVPGTPIALETRPGTNDIVVASGSPSSLWSRQGATCETSGCEIPEDTGRRVDLPGTVTDFVISPDGLSAFVAYRDLNFISVVDLDSMTIQTSIGGTASCSDGIDNDGDGLTDAQDPQCFGPFGAEAAGFAGRTSTTTCQDGLDNDEDGLVDREDPDCVTPDSEETSSVAVSVATTACNDGVDNDNDGNVDYPADPNCYGPYGATEVAIEPTGFDAIDIDELGQFVYLVDRAGSQVVVIDAQRRVAIDASRASDPPTSAFTNLIGVSVLPTPLDVTATVRRDCLTDSNVALPCDSFFFEGTSNFPAYTHDSVVVRYAYGAWAAEDTGRLRYIETMDAFCTLPTSDVKKALGSRFVEPGALDDSLEKNCIFVPAFPLTARTDYAGTCDATCDDCETSLLEQRFFCQNDQSIVINPKFSLVDVLASTGRTGGKSQCEIPSDVDAQLRNLANLPNAPRNFRCTSQLLPQPIAVEAAALDPDGFPSLDAYDRANLLTTRQVYFGWAGSALALLDFERVVDERLINESWTVAYEGILPSARRSDGLLPTQVLDLNGISVVEFDAAPLDLCAAGVQEGDRLTLEEAPTNDAECEGLKGDAGFLTFEIVEMTSTTLTLAVIEGEDFAQELPTRSCFPRGLNYSVRPQDQWIVVGERSGLVSERENVFGVCIDIPVNEGEPTRRSRVRTGETFVGPYFEFYMWPGPDARDPQTGEIIAGTPAVAPKEGLSFTFSVVPNFLSRSFATEGIFPAKVISYQRGDYYRVLSTDANSNFLFFKDGRSSSEFGTRLR